MLFSALLLIIVFLALVYINGKYNEKYWNKRGVAYDSSNKYLGPMFEFIYSKLSVYEILQRIHKSHPDVPAVGMASFFSPAVLILDPTNIQHVLASDFNSFNHRGFEVNENDILSDNLFFMTGKRWKLMRQHMSPLFTSTKLRCMYYILHKSAKDFVEYLETNPQCLRGNTFETVETFCSAAISAAVFGVGTTSIFDSPFFKMAQEANKTTLKIKMAFAISSVSPAMFKFLGIKMFAKFEDFFIGAIKKIIRTRKYENVKRHDFVDICLSLQNKGTLKDPDTGLEIQATDEILAAQAFFFFLAGVEPTADGMFSTLVELGRHPEVLKKVHEEIDEAFENHTEITYDVLSAMEYLDEVVSEALRLHPPISNLSRQCIHDTMLPVGNIKIDKGTKIFIPVYEIHYDAKYYRHPEEFIPERFSKDNKPNIASAAYMPFGKGSRNCLGTKYALLQAKAGLVHVLRNYTVKTILKDNIIKYKKNIIQLRISNADVELVPRII